MRKMKIKRQIKYKYKWLSRLRQERKKETAGKCIKMYRIKIWTGLNEILLEKKKMYCSLA